MDVRAKIWILVLACWAENGMLPDTHDFVHNFGVAVRLGRESFDG